MSTQFKELNLAPAAQRHSLLSRLLCLASIAALLACLYPLQSTWYANEEANERLVRAATQLKKRQVQVQRDRLDESTPDAVARGKTRAQVQDMARLSWDGFFDVLEISAKAVDAGVSVLAMVPSKVATGATHVNVTALASNAPIMLAYLESLKEDPRVLEAELVTQQPDEKSGPSVIRFQANVQWDPNIYIEKTANHREAIEEAQARARSAPVDQARQGSLPIQAPVANSPAGAPPRPLPMPLLAPTPAPVASPIGAPNSTLVTPPMAKPSRTPQPTSSPAGAKQ